MEPSKDPIIKYLLLIEMNPPKPEELFEDIFAIKFLLKKFHIFIELKFPTSIKL